jgi:hypothetical protein
MGMRWRWWIGYRTAAVAMRSSRRNRTSMTRSLYVGQIFLREIAVDAEVHTDPVVRGQVGVAADSLGWRDEAIGVAVVC